MNYAIDYAPVGDSEVIAWDNGSEPTHIVLKSDKKPGAKTGAFGGNSKKTPKKQACLFYENK
jgi:hypothetical protein